MWGAAMNDVAAEYTAGLASLSPAERHAARVRANVLSNCANELMSGKAPPRPQPGDRGDALRPKSI
jgi:hypothetical protein